MECSIISILAHPACCKDLVFAAPPIALRGARPERKFRGWWPCVLVPAVLPTPRAPPCGRLLHHRLATNGPQFQLTPALRQFLRAHAAVEFSDRAASA